MSCFSGRMKGVFASINHVALFFIKYFYGQFSVNLIHLILSEKLFFLVSLSRVCVSDCCCVPNATINHQNIHMGLLRKSQRVRLSKLKCNIEKKRTHEEMQKVCVYCGSKSSSTDSEIFAQFIMLLTRSFFEVHIKNS